MKTLRVLAICCLPLLATIPIALAYSYSGLKWYKTPGTIRTVDIDPIGRSQAEELAIRNAMSSWSNAGAAFYYVDTTASGNDFRYYYESGTTTLAITTVQTNWLGYIIRVYIRVNTFHPWATNGDPNKFDFESMAVHELGHGLKLNHSSYSDATMYYAMPKGETKNRSLHTDDINGIKYIYGSR